MYFYYIALLLVQTASTWHHHWGCWGKHCHGKDSHEWCSKERQSNEGQSHERHYHGHNCGKDSSSEEDDENVNETDEVENNTSPTRNSEIEDGDSYEFQNSSTVC